MALFSITNGKVADDMLFSIADQIKHGIGNLAAGENSELRLDMAKLYGFAGVRAAASSDHIASRSYLEHALSRLSPDPWTSHYDLCLQFSLRLAKSCYSCGDAERAQSILQVITGHCRSIEDKVPAHALLATSECCSC
jgi:predicted ATPase